MISIYKIVDNTNQNIYVGSTKQKIRKRIQGHKSNCDCRSDIIIKNNDWNYYVIEECEEDKRKEREQYWIDNLDNVVNKFNTYFNKKEYHHKYNKRREKWISSFGEKLRDPYSLIWVNPDLFL